MVTKIAEDFDEVVKDMTTRLVVDMGRGHIVFSSVRHLLAMNIAKLHDPERLALFEFMCATCRHSLDMIENGAITAVIVDILDFKSFYNIDAKVRALLSRSQ